VARSASPSRPAAPFPLVTGHGFGPDHHLLDAGKLAVVGQALIHPDNR
jgi:hypothetical protein